MKFSHRATVAFATMLQVSTADFLLYKGRSGGNGFSANLGHWGVVEPNPDCDSLPNVPIWPQEDDVNEVDGIRCEGDGCGYDYDPNEIDVLEMRFSALLHWTIYKDRNFELWSEVAKVGYCDPIPGDEHECTLGIGTGIFWSKFHCYVQSTVDDINAEAPFHRYLA